MDSGNSGSLQSSSCGGGGGGGGGDDQEYDDSVSRPNSMIYNSVSLQPSMINPGFARNNNNNNNNNNNYSSVVSVSSPSSLYFNSPSEYLNIFSQSNLNQSSLMNQDVAWSRDLQQLDQPNYSNDLINQNPTGGNSLQMSQNNHSINVLASQTQGSSTTMLRPNHENGSRIMKNSKKRTRASRRAPTTVLTTDTSNFRAMVQEFTGIPAPPFSTASSTFSRRFDLFRSGPSSLFPIRPDNISSQFGSSNANTTTTTTNNTNNLNSNYEPLLNIPHSDPMLTFQSQLQPNSAFTNQTKYDGTQVFGTRARGGSTNMAAQNGEQSIRNGNMNQLTQEKGSGIMLNHGSSRGGELGTVDSWIRQSD